MRAIIRHNLEEMQLLMHLPEVFTSRDVDIKPGNLMRYSNYNIITKLGTKKCLVHYTITAHQKGVIQGMLGIV